MIKFFNSQILNGSSRSITSAAAVLALSSLASRLLGLLRDRLLAGQFGAGDILDAYYAAFRVPDLVYNLLITGALSAGFIPVFVGLWKKNEITSPGLSSFEERRQIGSASNHQEAWEFVNGLLNILIIGLVIVGVLLVVFMPFLMQLITPGFVGEKLDLAVLLSRIMLLSPLMLGISSVWGGILQSVKKFLLFSLTPIFYNLGIIGGILFLVPRFGAAGLAFGVALGSLAHMLIQTPAIFSLGYKYQWRVNWFGEGVWRLARLMVPRTLTIAVSQLNFLAITVIASTLAAGNLAILNLTYNIWTFPLGILAASLATAAFPALSADVVRGDRAGFAANFSVTFRQILFLIIPASVLFFVLREQIVSVILGTGRFTLENMALTSSALGYLIFGLFAEALGLLLVRGFFAHEDTKTPFWLGFLSSGARIGGAWWFSFSLGVAGLALGYALGGILNMILLWVFLTRRAGGLQFGKIMISGVKILIASLSAGGIAWLVLLLASWIFDASTLAGFLLPGALAGLAGLAIYFLTGYFLRLREMRDFCQALKNRLPFKQVAPDKEIIQD